MKKIISFFILTLCLTTLNSTTYANEEMTMDPAMAEKMAQAKALGSPSEAHKVLDNFVGSWTYQGSFWMAPDGEAQLMEGTGTNELIFGGRYLKQSFEGPWMGASFNGLGYTGYDNVREEYVSVWFDNMATGMMNTTGSYDAANQTLNFSGSHSCIMTGEKEKHYRSEWKIIDENSNVYSSYTLTPDGTEFKAMEITYTRAS